MRAIVPVSPTGIKEHAIDIQATIPTKVKVQPAFDDDESSFGVE